MQNYFTHMNFTDIVAELLGKEDIRAQQIMLIACLIVSPTHILFPTSVADITEE